MERTDKTHSNSCVNRNLLTFITSNWILYVTIMHIYAEREKKTLSVYLPKQVISFWGNSNFKNFDGKKDRMKLTSAITQIINYMHKTQI
jgi:hypothetical protein